MDASTQNGLSRAGARQRRWLLPFLTSTVGLLLLWAYGARPVGAPAQSELEASAEAASSAAVVTATPSASPTPSLSPTAVTSAPLKVTVPEPVPVSGPARLRLLDQRITAPVSRTGLASDGSMVIPKDPGVIGWYSHGALPGAAKGSMVLAGHINSRTSGPGVLAALSRAKVGETVVVQLADGRGFAYRVNRIEQFHKRELPITRIFDDAGAHRLTMLTCSGRFLGRGLGYEDNLVVTAVPLS